MKKQESCGGNTIQRVLSDALRRNTASLLMVTTLLVAALSVTAGQPSCQGGKRGFETMQANLYIGPAIEQIGNLDPSDPNYLSNLVYTVTYAYYAIAQSQPQVRIAGLADQIVARMPDIVAVEEGTLLCVQSPGDLIVGGSTSATNVVFDYVQILVDALNARGAHYAVASSSEEWQVEVPMKNLQTGTIDDVRQLDREAILVRTDLPRGQLRVSNPQHGNFTTNLTYSFGLTMTRGWCSVDVFVRGQVFRYICAHLEQENWPTLQVVQAREIVNGPAKTRLPVMIVGDFNADPLHRDGSIAYDQLPLAGFRDTWAVLHRNNPAGGLTWGPDEYLANPARPLDRRIDFVFYRGCSFIPTRSEPLNIWLGRDTWPLWSSDHAALPAEFLLK